MKLGLNLSFSLSLFLISYRWNRLESHRCRCQWSIGIQIERHWRRRTSLAWSRKSHKRMVQNLQDPRRKTWKPIRLLWGSKEQSESLARAREEEMMVRLERRKGKGQEKWRTREVFSESLHLEGVCRSRTCLRTNDQCEGLGEVALWSFGRLRLTSILSSFLSSNAAFLFRSIQKYATWVFSWGRKLIFAWKVQTA